ncbi:interleukin-15 [Cololabis saira]|uniref:interleukin-15 n=1 Tax=Cololabis saira TaxID=129043 RepID=UPI002AD2747A|nr:interleukin-15 [Cololabis saira]
MTGSMKRRPGRILQPTCPQPAKEDRFQWTCNLCQDSHKTQVWLCFLILSCLSICTSATFVSETEDLQTCLEELRDKLEKSDAKLYSPSVNDFKDNCINMTLKCYMLELKMVIYEEDIQDSKASCIFQFSEALRPETGCPPCEIYTLANITNFLERLTTILQKINARQNEK